MQLFLDSDDHRSLSDQLYDQIRDAIADRRLAPGSRLQPSRMVADELGIARSTVTDAYGRLTAEGYVAGRRGGGSIVQGYETPRSARRLVRTALEPTARAAEARRYGDAGTDARFDLTAGRIDSSLFPQGEWRRCTGRALSSLDHQYGQYGDPAGDSDLRRVLARWVTRSRGVDAAPEQIVVTHGAGHAVDLLARTLLRPGDVAAVEEPGYPPVTTLLRVLGIDVVGVPVDEDGLIVEALPDRAKLVHVTPSHQYPLGVVLSRERRVALLRWAQRHGAAIVEDDYDTEFRYTARPLEPLHRLDQDGRVIYVGTFSKILSPALRTGFAVVPSGIVSAVTAVRQAVDSGPSPLIAAPLAAFIVEGGLDRHLRRARRAYTARHHAVWAGLAELSDSSLTPMPTEAGLHVTLLAADAPDDPTLRPGSTMRAGSIVPSPDVPGQPAQARRGHRHRSHRHRRHSSGDQYPWQVRSRLSAAPRAR